MELGLAYAEVEWAYNSVGPTDSKLLETRCGGRLGGIGIFSTAKKPHPFKAQSLFERYSPRPLFDYQFGFACAGIRGLCRRLLRRFFGQPRCGGAQAFFGKVSQIEPEIPGVGCVGESGLEINHTRSNQLLRSEEHTSELQSLRHLVCR